MIPGRVNRLNFTVERPGVYRGQCAEFCGAPARAHGLRRGRRSSRPTSRPGVGAGAARPASRRDPFRARGRDLFRSGGCGACHAVRGTEADGQIGPDLTHVGSRLSLGAAPFPNNIGTLAGWIADVQHIKPGARMPSYGRSPARICAPSPAYLESLK